MPKRHILDQVAEDLADWIEEQAQSIVGAVTEGGVAPFSANLSSEERLAYYRRQFFLPDGTPNVEGRAQEMERLGLEGFTKAMRAVMDHQSSIRTQAASLNFRPPGY
jgi:hypothetical protein